MKIFYIILIILVSLWLVWNLFLIYTIHRLNKKPAKSKRVRENRRKRFITAWINIAVVLLIVGLICTGMAIKNYINKKELIEATKSNIYSYPTSTDSSSIEATALNTPSSNISISPTVDAKNMFVYDITNSQIIYEKNSDTEISPASTTKLLTALTVLKHCSPDEIVTVGSEIYNIAEDASSAYLTEGDVLTVEDLLVAMLLPSGNDAAYTLAKYTGGKILENSNIYDYTDTNAIGTFVEEMNFTATSLGATSSFFVTPDGYEAEGQHTTAKDLALITKACLDNQIIMDIVSKPSIYCKWENGREVTYYNTNELLNPESMYYYEGTSGMKTGYSDNAGACIISTVNIDGLAYICVVMDSSEDGRWSDTLSIFTELEKLN